MIIDMRCRLTTKEAAKYYFTLMEKAGRLSQVPALVEGTIESFFNEIEAAGITTAVSASGYNPGFRIGSTIIPDRTTPNDLLAEVQKKYPGKFIGVAGIDAGNVFHNALEEIERCIKGLGLKAIHLNPGRSPGCEPSDRRLYPIYCKCSDLDVPVIIETSAIKGGMNIDYANPKYIEELAADFPNLTIICAHACNPFVREMITVAARRDNVYVEPDTSLYPQSRGNLTGALPMGKDEWIWAVNENYFGLEDKFLFASAYPLISIKSYVDEFLKLPWREEVIDKILYKNAIKALKLESDPIIRSMYKLD